MSPKKGTLASLPPDVTSIRTELARLRRCSNAELTSTKREIDQLRHSASLRDSRVADLEEQVKNTYESNRRRQLAAIQRQQEAEERKHGGGRRSGMTRIKSMPSFRRRASTGSNSSWGSGGRMNLMGLGLSQQEQQESSQKQQPQINKVMSRRMSLGRRSSFRKLMGGGGGGGDDDEGNDLSGGNRSVVSAAAWFGDIMNDDDLSGDFSDDDDANDPPMSTAIMMNMPQHQHQPQPPPSSSSRQISPSDVVIDVDLDDAHSAPLLMMRSGAANVNSNNNRRPSLSTTGALSCAASVASSYGILVGENGSLGSLDDESSFYTDENDDVRRALLHGTNLDKDDDDNDYDGDVERKVHAPQQQTAAAAELAAVASILNQPPPILPKPAAQQRQLSVTELETRLRNRAARLAELERSTATTSRRVTELQRRIESRRTASQTRAELRLTDKRKRERRLEQAKLRVEKAQRRLDAVTQTTSTLSTLERRGEGLRQEGGQPTADQTPKTTNKKKKNESSSKLPAPSSSYNDESELIVRNLQSQIRVNEERTLTAQVVKRLVERNSHRILEELIFFVGLCEDDDEEEEDGEGSVEKEEKGGAHININGRRDVRGSNGEGQGDGKDEDGEDCVVAAVDQDVKDEEEEEEEEEEDDDEVIVAEEVMHQTAALQRIAGELHLEMARGRSVPSSSSRGGGRPLRQGSGDNDEELGGDEGESIVEKGDEEDGPSGPSVDERLVRVCSVLNGAEAIQSSIDAALAGAVRLMEEPTAPPSKRRNDDAAVRGVDADNAPFPGASAQEREDWEEARRKKNKIRKRTVRISQLQAEVSDGEEMVTALRSQLKEVRASSKRRSEVQLELMKRMQTRALALFQLVGAEERRRVKRLSKAIEQTDRRIVPIREKIGHYQISGMVD